jgi:hypothetical protein
MGVAMLNCWGDVMPALLKPWGWYWLIVASIESIGAMLVGNDESTGAMGQAIMDCLDGTGGANNRWQH